MKKPKVIFFLFGVFVFFSALLCAQNNPDNNREMDSLLNKLKHAKEDTIKLNILNQLSEICAEEDILKYAEPSFKLSEKLCSSPIESINKAGKRGLANASNNIGYVYKKQGNIFKAMEWYLRSLKTQEEIGDKHGIANLFNNIGIIYYNQGDIPKALEWDYKSLKIREEIGDKKGVAYSLNNIGFIYDKQGNSAKALECYNKSLKIREEIEDKLGIATSLNNIGFIYNDQGNIAQALECYNKSLKIKEEIGDKKGIANSLSSIGSVYIRQGDMPKALELFYKSLKIREEIGDKQGLANSQGNLGGIYFKLASIEKTAAIKQKNYMKAEKCCKYSLQIAKEMGYPEEIRNAAQQLSSIYKATGRHKLAFENYELFVRMNDSINNEQIKKASVKNQLKYEYEKKAAADSVKVAEEKKVISAQLKQEQTQRYALYGGLGLVIIFVLFMVNRFLVTNKQKKLIEEQKRAVEVQKYLVEEKQKEVLDSIYYARRIQRALITSEFYIAKSLRKFRDHF